MSEDMGGFDVKRVGREAVVVKHPAGTTKIYHVEDEVFWKKSRDGQRKTAIDAYVEGLDFAEMDPVAANRILRDAGWLTDRGASEP